MTTTSRLVDRHTKSTLYCPNCWHASPARGDWLLRDHGHDEAVVCPACGATLTVRPRSTPVVA